MTEPEWWHISYRWRALGRETWNFDNCYTQLHPCKWLVTMNHTCDEHYELINTIPVTETIVEQTRDWIWVSSTESIVSDN